MKSTIAAAGAMAVAVAVAAMPTSSLLQSRSDYLSDPITGSSTTYGGNLNGGTCMFTDLVLPAGVYGTAFSGSNWNNGEKCGACMEITGPNGVTIKAMVVDQCPECDLGHLDIFADGFSQLAPTPGIINTSYRFTTCDISSPLVLHNKTGTSPYWFSIQVLNTSEPVANLEVSTDGGNTWLPTARQPYNFFENPAGFRTDRVMVKVTSETGKVVVVDGVGMDSDAKFTGPSNF